MLAEDKLLAGEIARILSDDLLLEFEADADLVESGALDSVNVVRLLSAIEQHFGVVLPLDSLTIDTFRSTSAIAEAVSGELQHPDEHDVALAALRD